MAKNDRIDTEILISVIEENRSIWDTSHEKYNDRDIKNKAFAAVAAVVEPNYMTEAKQREAVQVVQERWKTARDAYQRDGNKVTNTMSGQAVMDLNSTESNLDHVNTDEEVTRDSTDESESIDTERPTHEGSITSVPPKSSRQQKAMKRKNIDDKLISFLDDIKKPKHSDGGDMALFESLLDTLQTFDINQKLQFRSEVLRIMMEIKNVPKFHVANTNVLQYTSYADQQSYNMSPMQGRFPYNVFAPHQPTHSHENNSRASSTTLLPTPSPASSNEAYVQPTSLQLAQTNLDVL